MDGFIQQLLNGLMTGSLYALVALGYTMVYGILRIINFAHGDVLMIGALVGLSVIRLLQAAFPDLAPMLVLLCATLVAMAFCAVLAVVIERVAYRRLRHAPRLAPLISGIGVSLLLQTIAMLVWTRNPQMFPQLLPLEPIEVLAGASAHPAITNATALTTIAIALSVMVALLVLVERTRFGRAMRAVALYAAWLSHERPSKAFWACAALGSALVLSYAYSGFRHVQLQRWRLGECWRACRNPAHPPPG